MDHRIRLDSALCVALLTVTVVCGGESPPPDVLWFKRFGPGEASAFSVREVRGDGFVAAGLWGPSGQRHAYLLRLSPLGEFLWDIVLDTEGQGQGIANSVDVAEGGFIVAGESSFAGTTWAYLAMVSHAGELLWEKRFRSSSIRPETIVKTTAIAVTAANEGGAVFLAEIGLVSNDGRVYAAKTGSRGDLEWERMVSDKGKGAAWRIRQTRDGGYVAVTTTTGSEDRLLLTKLSRTGAIAWQRVYVGERMWDLSVEELFDGFVVTGAKGKTIRVLRTDLGGAVLREAEFDRAAVGVRHLADGEYVSAVTAVLVEGRSSAVLSKFDELGALTWEMAFGEDYTGIHAFDVTSDGGLVAAGYVSSASRRADIFVARLSPTGVGRFVRGDSNDDGRANLADAVFSLNRLFGGGEEPECLQATDVDDDGEFKLTDPVFLLQHLFQSGPRPPAPFENCGIDTTLDNLMCTGARSCDV